MSTVLHRLQEWAQSDPSATAQRYKSGNEWKSISVSEFRDRVYHLALFLQSKGIRPTDSSAIFSYNSPQWVQADLATLLLKTKSAGLYPNSTQKDIHYILGHTEAAALFVQNQEYYKRIVGEKGEVPLPAYIRLVVVFEGDPSFLPGAVSFENALAEGERIARSGSAKSFEAYLGELDPKAGAFLIYTSGTTGNPKGALLSHDNLVFASDLAVSQWNLPARQGSLFSFLPLCHIAEKLQNIGVGISQRYTVSFCTKFDNVATELPEVEPTLLLCVPRLWEKMMEGVLNKLKRAPAARQKLANWALAVGARVAEAKYARRLPNPLDLLQHRIADALVISKIRKALGLGKAEILASGAAALPAHVAHWFRCLSLEILEDYGQTETTGVVCMTDPGVDCLGTVGRPLPGTEFKLAEDGEILTRGRHVFVGYFKDPGATATVLDGGWLHTGDLGEYNEKGFIRIRGRKKEILKTSGGKMVAPLPIEEKLKEAEVISQVCMVGDGRKYLSALVTLSEAMLQELANKVGALTGKVVSDPEIVAQVSRHVETLNQELASYEQIKRFAILSREFSIADGEMTPTLKMKRNVIEARFKDVIDSMY